MVHVYIFENISSRAILYELQYFCSFVCSKENTSAYIIHHTCLVMLYYTLISLNTMSNVCIFIYFILFIVYNPSQHCTQLSLCGVDFITTLCIALVAISQLVWTVNTKFLNQFIYATLSMLWIDQGRIQNTSSVSVTPTFASMFTCFAVPQTLVWVVAATTS